MHMSIAEAAKKHSTRQSLGGIGWFSDTSGEGVAARSRQFDRTWRLDMADRLSGQASGRQVIVGLAAM